MAREMEARIIGDVESKLVGPTEQYDGEINNSDDADLWGLWKFIRDNTR